MKKGKLTFGQKIGYGSAAAGDSVGYMLVGTFLMFFLTTVAGIQPATAGTITVVAAVWDAIANPIMGYISDHASTRWGRRRPFIFIFSFPVMITMTLLFTTFDMSYGAKVIYYGFMAIAFWSSFTGFFVPYYALGAEYTQDYDERTSLRSVASFFNMVGTLFSMVIPMYAVEFMENRGMSEQTAWTLTAAALGVIAMISMIITAAVSGEFDTPAKATHTADAKATHTEAETGNSTKSKSKGDRFSLLKIFRESAEVLRLKPARLLLLHTIFFLITYSMVMSTFVYFFTYNHGAEGSEVSFYLAIRCAVGIVIIPFVEKLCSRTDKRTGMLIIMAACGVLMVIFRIVPLTNIVLVILFILVTGTVTCTYWQIVPAIFYDLCQYDEYVTGRKREGTILAMQGLTEAVSAGLGSQILGIILQCAGFDGSAETQTETALAWIYNCTTWVPVISLVLAAAALYAFPITKQYYNNMIKELNERNNNE